MRFLSTTLILSVALFGCGEPDADGDGFTQSFDCDDTNAAVNDDAAEICDGIDNDCDGFTDDDASVVDAPLWYLDRDVDGYGDDEVTKVTCEAPGGGWALEGGDCDDTDPLAAPGGQEVCNGKDDDCDGIEDNADQAEGVELWYEDADFDTFGDPDKGEMRCPQQVPRLWVKNGDDCDDSDRDQYPGAQEYCNDEDDDCDSQVDELSDVADGFDAWVDKDNDGYGDPSTTVYVCSLPDGYTDQNGDCNDDDDVVALGCGCTTGEGGDLIVTGTTTLQGGRHDFANVVVNPGATLRFTGAEPVYLFAESVTVDGVIDLAGKGQEGGAGGGRGGNGSTSCTTSAGGSGGNSTFGGGGGTGGPLGYGGGGGGAADDGSPGASGTYNSGGKGGPRFGDSTLEEIFAGGGAGGGGGSQGGAGGGGGGAIKIVAGVIDISGTIDVRGGDGRNANTSYCYYNGGGGGGGAGGAVWLHGDRVEFTGEMLIGGGRGGNGTTGGYYYYEGLSGGTGSYGRVRLSGKRLVNTGSLDEDRPYTDTADPSCDNPFDEEEEEAK